MSAWQGCVGGVNTQEAQYVVAIIFHENVA